MLASFGVVVSITSASPYPLAFSSLGRHTAVLTTRSTLQEETRARHLRHLALVAVLVIVAIFRAVRIVKQSTAIIVERLGRFQAAYTAGMHFLVPFVDRVRNVMDLREQVVSFPPQPVITSDNLVVSIDSVVYYQITTRHAPPTRSPTTCRPSSS